MKENKDLWQEAIDIIFIRDPLELKDYVELHKIASEVDIQDVVMQVVSKYTTIKWASDEEAVAPLIHAGLVANSMNALYKEAGWASLILKPISKLWHAYKGVGKRVLKGVLSDSAYKAVGSQYKQLAGAYDKWWMKNLAPHLNPEITKYRKEIGQGVALGATWLGGRKLKDESTPKKPSKVPVGKVCIFKLSTLT